MGINRRLLRSTQMEKTSNPISAFQEAGTDSSFSFPYLRSFALSAVMKFPGVFGQRDLTANLLRSTQMKKTSNPISAFDDAGTDSSFSFQYLRSFALSAVMKFPGASGQRARSRFFGAGGETPLLARLKPNGFVRMAW